MADTRVRDDGFVNRNRWMFASPPDAIDFLTTLVDAVAAKWNITDGTQVVPDGASAAHQMSYGTCSWSQRYLSEALPN